MVLRNNIPNTASIAERIEGSRLSAPSAVRNASAIIKMMTNTLPKVGEALEIASGTGQHIVKLARAFPAVVWQPSDADPEKLKSIAAWTSESNLSNIKPACILDATNSGWAVHHANKDIILLINLLHLISLKETYVLLHEISKALKKGGISIFYGPFMRNGKLTSAGDISFHNSLVKSDPELGYKNDSTIHAMLKSFGLKPLKKIKMPANNLALVAQKPN